MYSAILLFKKHHILLPVFIEFESICMLLYLSMGAFVGLDSLVSPRHNQRAMCACRRCYWMESRCLMMIQLLWLQSASSSSRLTITTGGSPIQRSLRMLIPGLHVHRYILSITTAVLNHAQFCVPLHVIHVHQMIAHSHMKLSQ